MAKGPVRRSQLIAPFGVGSIIVTRDGLSLVCAGLDHWYERENGAGGPDGFTDTSEYDLSEQRLERMLGVSHFRLPPDYRDPAKAWGTADKRNLGLTVPFLRFPQWHVCPKCGLLRRVALDYPDWVRCEDCKMRLTQVRFIAMCEHGHLQDFPWNEWVHRTAHPQCTGDELKLRRAPGTSLSAFVVKCEECKKAKRNLDGITTTTAGGSSTLLTDRLDDSGQPFLCQGHRPWLGETDVGSCTKPLRGALPGAANVYYSHVASAVYVPVVDPESAKAAERMRSVPLVRTMFKWAKSAGEKVSVEDVVRASADFLEGFDEEAIVEAVRMLNEETGEEHQSADTTPAAFRAAEYHVLRSRIRHEDLEAEPVLADKYARPVSEAFARIGLVKRLRETRALGGFTRVFPENDMTPQQMKSLLRRRPLRPADDWLPAYVVHGEGIYLELDLAPASPLRRWETEDVVVERLRPLRAQFAAMAKKRRIAGFELTPRFVLLHTLAHLLMNRFTFDCGYSSAALRERLFVSHEPDSEMAGVLIYTAAGDSEGTLGGLVRMGQPGWLEPVLQRALENARWCSADPVCMEMGVRGGQGPDSCNLAACHSCSLVPETACEHFNRFLDRALVVGSPDEPDLGFFNAVAK